VSEEEGFQSGAEINRFLSFSFLVVFRALVRPGRFDRVIAVPLPDVRGRNQILQHHMKEVVAAPG